MIRKEYFTTKVVGDGYDIGVKNKNIQYKSNKEYEPLGIGESVLVHINNF